MSLQRPFTPLDQLRRRSLLSFVTELDPPVGAWLGVDELRRDRTEHLPDDGVWNERHAAWTPERVDLIDQHRGQQTTYGELAARVRSLAWSRAEKGVGAEHQVAVSPATTPALSRSSTRARCSGRRPRRSRSFAAFGGSPAPSALLAAWADGGVALTTVQHDDRCARPSRRNSCPLVPGSESLTAHPW
ncbi:hypothetical protein PHK61_28705 [Actinomycetospora lutea]|uniref:hypothetical protein n=1 Tax=Actinomycetospora lutea TaxID=663604 RepID=UPI002365191B|nr:hypothetical protein [Actinomycetospora lutea]MDD7942403.1 hypothetical protein [Actinomycetospora lutea]